MESVRWGQTGCAEHSPGNTRISTKGDYSVQRIWTKIEDSQAGTAL